MSKVTRRNMMVYQFGYSHDQVDECANKVKKFKKQREKSKMISSAGERRLEIAETVFKMMKINVRSGRDKLIEEYTPSSSLKRSNNGIISTEENEYLNQCLMMVR